MCLFIRYEGTDLEKTVILWFGIRSDHLIIVSARKNEDLNSEYLKETQKNFSFWKLLKGIAVCALKKNKEIYFNQPTMLSENLLAI